jgi:wyosine [tRNA(Phe)-imidazoG37] synthetase (radical SAM superfamily)
MENDTTIIVNNSVERDTTIIVNNLPENKTSIIINDTSEPLKLLNSYISKLSSNLEKYESVSTNVITNSTTYLNVKEIEQINIIQTLTSQWDETYHEVNTMQNELTANWQENTEYVLNGVLDAGFF